MSDEIRDLLARYALALDAHDIAGGLAMFTENADPDCFWQCVQWQAAIRTGSAAQTYRMLPQRQLPAIFGMATSRFRSDSADLGPR